MFNLLGRAKRAALERRIAVLQSDKQTLETRLTGLDDTDTHGQPLPDILCPDH